MSGNRAFARYIDVIPTEAQSSLLRGLDRAPRFDWLLGRPHPTEDRLQGDVLAEFPTVYLDAEAQPRARRFTVLILNNTCDLQPGRLDTVSVVPLLDFAHYVEQERSRWARETSQFNDFLRAVTRNEKTELLYLPNVSGFSAGAVAFLQMISSVSAKLYEDAVQDGVRLHSFSAPGVYYLLMKLTHHLARQESEEVFRTDPAILE